MNKTIILDTFCQKLQYENLPEPVTNKGRDELKTQIDLMGLRPFVGAALVNLKTYNQDCK